MRTLKKLSILIAVFALSALGAANASAATFTASSTGPLKGNALQTQVFTVSGGQVKCNKATTTGTITSTATTQQHVTVNYSECTAFGFANVHISPATYLFTAGAGGTGTVHLLNTITINVTLGGCHLTVHPQNNLASIKYVDKHPKIEVVPTVNNIKYTSTGGLCGPAGEKGTYTGANIIEHGTAGGTLKYDP